MSINLLDLAKTALAPTLINKAGQLFGLNSDVATKALNVVFPTILSGMMNKASTPEGAKTLFNAINDPSVDGNIANKLGDALSDGHSLSKMGESGGKIMGMLFGDKANDMGAQVAQVADLPNESAVGVKGLMALASPALFGLLKNQVTGSNLDQKGFLNLLSSQAPHLQASLPERISQWLGWGSVGSFFGGLTNKFTGLIGDTTAKTVAAAATVGTVAASTIRRDEPVKKGGGFLRWLLPLLLLGVLALFGMKYCTGSNTEITKKVGTTATSTTATTTKVEAPAAATKETQLSMVYDGAKAKLSATVATEAEKTDLMAKLEKVYGKDGFAADIKVDAQTKPADYLAKAEDLFTAAKVKGAEVAVSGKDIKLSGALADPKLGLVDKLKGAFTGFALSAAAFDAKAAIEEGKSKYETAIKAIDPAACKAADLATALNHLVINFSSGSNRVPAPDQMELSKAAAAVKGCSDAGSKIKVEGYTDNVGNAEANKKLSAARANAVKSFFVAKGAKADTITAEGMGDAAPVGDNNTEAGRFKNRRIAYTAQ